MLLLGATRPMSKSQIDEIQSCGMAPGFGARAASILGRAER